MPVADVAVLCAYIPLGWVLQPPLIHHLLLHETSLQSSSSSSSTTTTPSGINAEAHTLHPCHMLIVVCAVMVAAAESPHCAVHHLHCRPSSSLSRRPLPPSPSHCHRPCRPHPLPRCPHPLFTSWLLHRRLHLLSSPVSCPLSSSLPPPPCPLSCSLAGCPVITSASRPPLPLVHCRSPCRCLFLLFLGGGPRCHCRQRQ